MSIVLKLGHNIFVNKKGDALMKAIVFGGHPQGNESSSYQFLKESLPATVEFQQIPSQINSECRTKHQELIGETDRLFLLFPFFWYQAPGIVANWLTEIFDEDFFIHYGAHLKKLQFGIILTVGVPLKHYQAGGREQFTISELLRPYQAFAHALGFDYLPPYVLAQHSYQTAEQQQLSLVQFQQYLTLPANSDFHQRSRWFINELTRIQAGLADERQKQQAQIIIDEWADRLDELQLLEEQLPKTIWR